MHHQTVSQIEATLSQYRARLSGQEGDIRELVAIIDFHVRLLYTLAIAVSHKQQERVLRVAAMPGFGTMLAATYTAAQSIKIAADSPQNLSTRISNLVTTARTSIDAFAVPGRYTSFKMMRDQLSHGHPLPADKAQAAATLQNLSALESELSLNLATKLSDTSLLEQQGRTLLVSPTDHLPLDLLALWNISQERAGIDLYSHFSNEQIHYITPSGGISTCENQATNSWFSSELLIERKSTIGELGRFVKDLVADISAFTEDYSYPSYSFGEDAEAGHIFIPWTRPTSEGSDHRIDSFRIGLNNRREWRGSDSSPWVQYTDFLRDISNWQVLARRIGINLDAFSAARNQEEATRLRGGSTDSIRGPSILLEKQGDLNGNKKTVEFPLDQRVDLSCEFVKPSTVVYFIVGQAGLGKTDLMLSLAISRAKDIAQSPNSPKPLYLFVSSSGRTLASLDDAVNSALNITKLLSSQSAKALCRNGLLVLFVDGFDELLGSSGYENALGSLEPWFRDLSGRGVLVASARSSYYLTQYRQSLAQNSGLNVDHTLVEVQPWTKEQSEKYLRERKVPTDAILTIGEQDWKILGIPFFAKAFSAWFESGVTDGTLPKIFDIVVDQYLDRESSKLTDPAQGELLNAQELRSLFAEAAEMMQMSQSRELEQSDLVTCAQQVIGSESLDKARPGLTRRLSSLCGLGVSTDSSGQNQFSFSHEVLFDCFLSAALQQKFTPTFSEASFLNCLDKSAVNSEVFEWLLDKVQNAATDLAKLSRFEANGLKYERVLSQNLGTLWKALLVKNGGVPPTKRITSVDLGDISLSPKGWTNLQFDNCKISTLEIPPAGNFRVELRKCEVELLKCDSKDQIKAVLHSDDNRFASVHIGNMFGDDRIRIQEIMHAVGLAAAVPVSNTTQSTKAAIFFLDKIERRPDIPVIVSRDGKYPDAEDHRLAWTTSHQYGNDSWLTFVDLLVTNELARLESITTSGKPKVRLVFDVAPIAILEHADSPKISKFWRDLSSN